MDVEPILDHLKTLGLGFKQYSGAEDLANIQERLKSLPAVFVIPLAMQGAPNRLVGVTDQKITQRFTVMALFKKPSAGDLHTIDVAIMNNLIGWVHPDMHGGTAGSPAEFLSQRTLTLNGSLASAHDFTTHYHFRK